MTDFSGKGLACIRGERLVFRDLGFQIEGGGALVLTGPNGSGKSSLLRIMAGLSRPDAGTLMWKGAAVDGRADDHRGRVHYVGHADAVKPALSVIENVQFWAELLVDDGSHHVVSTKERAVCAIDALGIGHLSEVPGRFLSAGQRRRVSLARIAAVPAILWLLDEPRTALDAEAVRRLDSLIAVHRNAGGMVVLSLHAGERPEGAAVLDLSRFAAAEQAVVSPC